MRTLKYLLYLGIVAGAFAIGWPRFIEAWTVLLSAACYYPNPSFWPAWLALSIALGGYGLVFVIFALGKRPLRLLHHALVLALFASALMGRLIGPFWDPPQEQAWQNLADAPPHWLMARAAGRLHQGLSARGAIPASQEGLQVLIAEDGRAQPSGFVGHGRRQPVRLVRLAGQSGPVDQVRPGDGAGTLYLAVSPAGDQYWITAVGLSAYPRGEARLMADENDDLLVLRGGFGARERSGD